MPSLHIGIAIARFLKTEVFATSPQRPNQSILCHPWRPKMAYSNGLKPSTETIEPTPNKPNLA